MRAVSASIGALLVWCASARAETPPAVPPAAAREPAAAPAPMHEFPRLAMPSLTHAMQFGIAVMPGTGFRSIFPYQDQTYCGQSTTSQSSGSQAKRVCTGRLPFFLDAELSFGIGRRWDLLLALRFGIEADFTQTHQFAVAPGFRYWVDPEQSVKFFTTLQAVLDATDQQNPALQNNDFAVRNANGLMFEVMRNLGIYLQLGETLGFRRWLRFEIDFGVGVQARFP